MRETPVVRVRPRPVRPAGWWYDALLLAALVGLTVALVTHQLFGVDRAVADWAQEHRPAAAYWVARVLNLLGQGTPLTLIAVGLGVLLAVRVRSVRPVLPPLAAFVLTYLTIGPLKVWTARPAPSASVKKPFLPPDQTLPLFQEDLPLRFAQSYPSGHVANAIVWYGMLALLLAPLLRTYGRTIPPRLVLAVRVLPPLIVLTTTTYLGWHWLTDSVAGLLLGLLLDRLLHRVPWDDVPLPARLPGSARTRLFTSGP
ncbi:phosphatase PAP2 family protein [Micromonospora globbae]|uniref:Phosphatase PAP2 family protein n=1 Tax=Micromonospora globbae TaxID=1894969 RepID=A0A420EYZ8_9ACTN|nr:phosphatase PAP2 family protein [Micromonospora globbae]RKF25952.1 phosphatase PAP2 family protein [Micromonospora globbae]WTF85869.1 phosphatase PAP2 family protein [Micromonospora globbae]